MKRRTTRAAPLLYARGLLARPGSLLRYKLGPHTERRRRTGSSGSGCREGQLSAGEAGGPAGALWAGTLRRDLPAVELSMTTPWSTGPLEGQINRLKVIKRQMYGRAGFELLKARVLPVKPFPTC